MPPRHDDIVFAERRRDASIIVSIAGQFSVSRRGAARRARLVFACRAVNVSAQAIAFVSPVAVKVGDQISAEIEHLGRLEGAVIRTLARGFVMSISARDDERERLNDRIEWLERYKNHEARERRADRRFVPARRRTKMVFADGTELYCLLRDVSASGAAISSETAPPIGAVLAVGAMVGRVVRHFKGGFAVQFIQRLSDDRVHALARGD